MGLKGGRGSSLLGSLTLRKEVRDGDVTHQGLRGQQLGGHPSSAHGDQGTGRLWAEGERERCSERSGPGPTHNADTPTTRQLLQDKQTETCTLIHSEGTWGTYGFHGTLQILQEAVVMSRVQ